MFLKEIMSRSFSLSVPILVLSFICNVTAEKHLKLPTYVTPCSKSAPDFEECCRQHGQELLSILVKGDKEYDIPILNPLVLPSVEMDAGGFRIALKDLNVYGLDSMELKKVKFDLNKNELTINTYNEKISLIGKYHCDGNILVIQIQGNGNINVTITGLEIKYHVNYKLEEKGGDFYIVFPDDADIDYTLSRAYFDLGNLFGGNKELSDATLRALNDEWDKFLDVLKPIISQSIVKIAQSIAGGVTNNVPLKYIFLD